MCNGADMRALDALSGWRTNAQTWESHMTTHTNFFIIFEEYSNGSGRSSRHEILKTKKIMIFMGEMEMERQGGRERGMENFYIEQSIQFSYYYR